MRARRWNHNLHYHQVLLDAMPAGCQRALDVGCGEGTLARKLRRSARQVSAIDVDEASITAARREDPGQTIDYQLGDFLRFPFAPGSFDFVTCVAALHHMDAEAGLRRISELLAPGGALAVLGLARSRFPADLPRDLAAVIVNRAYRLGLGYWESPAPAVWPPEHTYHEIELLAGRVVPGARFRRHLLWRFSLVWTKPTS